jgi:retrograde regulation protein 2
VRLLPLTLNNVGALTRRISNGIRFSISSLAPPTARIMPTLFQDRNAISLYDAQYSTGVKGPIPRNIINDVVASLQRFKIVCEDFEVPDENIRVLATEATRTAENSSDFISAIKSGTGWQVSLLPKEEEGRVGAMGIASSFSSVKGLVMDLGGGSTQITWMIVENGDVKTGAAMSFPYGAAAMTRRLSDARSRGGDEELKLRQELISSYKKAFEELELPSELSKNAKENEGYSLYLSGGGFRGWGYLLMDKHEIEPYPIPIINGFQVTKDVFKNINRVQLTAINEEVFRVSTRRASQVPAVAFLIESLIEAIPDIKDVRFCQGGVREGVLYGLLSPEDLRLDPLETAALPFAKESHNFEDLLASSLPDKNADGKNPVFRQSLIRAFSHLLFAHTSLPKEACAPAALHSTTTGILASAHGISHNDRAVLALLLCERWGGEVAPTDAPFKQCLQQLVSTEEVFYTRYLGAVAALIGQVYPAGTVSRPKIRFDARHTTSSKGHATVKLVVHVRKEDPMTEESLLRKPVETIEKVGKKKHWIADKAGQMGYGRTIVVEVERDLE